MGRVVLYPNPDFRVFGIAKKYGFLRQDVHDFSSFIVKNFDIIDDFLKSMLSYFEKCANKSENEKDNSCLINFIFWLILDSTQSITTYISTFLIFGVIFFSR